MDRFLPPPADAAPRCASHELAQLHNPCLAPSAGQKERREAAHSLSARRHLYVIVAARGTITEPEWRWPRAVQSDRFITLPLHRELSTLIRLLASGRLRMVPRPGRLPPSEVIRIGCGLWPMSIGRRQASVNCLPRSIRDVPLLKGLNAHPVPRSGSRSASLWKELTLGENGFRKCNPSVPVDGLCPLEYPGRLMLSAEVILRQGLAYFVVLSWQPHTPICLT